MPPALAPESTRPHPGRGALVLNCCFWISVGLFPYWSIFFSLSGMPLSDLYPISIKKLVVPLSALAMPLSAAATRAWIYQKPRLEIWKLLTVTALLAVSLLAFYSLTCRTLPYGTESRQATFIVGFARPPSCQCSIDAFNYGRQISDEECISSLSLSTSAISDCWGQSVRWNRLLIALLYLGTTSLFAAVVTLLGSRLKTSKPIAPLARPSTGSVFVGYNSNDKETVTEVCNELRGQGLSLWIDHEQILPGQPVPEALQKGIRSASAALLFLGEQGLGPWQSLELRSILEESVDRGMTVIPVLLPETKEVPRDLVFLRSLQHVRLRSPKDETGIRQIYRGLTVSNVASQDEEGA